MYVCVDGYVFVCVCVSVAVTSILDATLLCVCVSVAVPSILDATLELMYSGTSRRDTHTQHTRVLFFLPELRLVFLPELRQ